MITPNPAQGAHDGIASNRNSQLAAHLRVGPEAEDVAAERGDGGVRAMEPVLRRRGRAQAAQEPVYAIPHGRLAGSLAASPARQDDEFEDRISGRRGVCFQLSLSFLSGRKSAPGFENLCGGVLSVRGLCVDLRRGRCEAVPEKSILFPAIASASILSANAVSRSVHPYSIWLYSFVFYFFHSRISAIHRVKDSIDPRESLSVPASPSALFTVNSPLLIFLPFFTHLGKTILYCSSCQQ